MDSLEVLYYLIQQLPDTVKKQAEDAYSQLKADRERSLKLVEDASKQIDKLTMLLNNMEERMKDINRRIDTIEKTLSLKEQSANKIQNAGWIVLK
jgi:predicted  nucleic acid-binding Zn-ribbon protein